MQFGSHFSTSVSAVCFETVALWIGYLPYIEAATAKTSSLMMFNQSNKKSNRLARLQEDHASSPLSSSTRYVLKVILLTFRCTPRISAAIALQVNISEKAIGRPPAHRKRLDWGTGM